MSCGAAADERYWLMIVPEKPFESVARCISGWRRDGFDVSPFFFPFDGGCTEVACVRVRGDE
jgi:hypothetical protein